MIFSSMEREKREGIAYSDQVDDGYQVLIVSQREKWETSMERSCVSSLSLFDSIYLFFLHLFSSRALEMALDHHRSFIALACSSFTHRSNLRRRRRFFTLDIWPIDRIDNRDTFIDRVMRAIRHIQLYERTLALTRLISFFSSLSLCLSIDPFIIIITIMQYHNRTWPAMKLAATESIEQRERDEKRKRCIDHRGHHTSFVDFRSTSSRISIMLQHDLCRSQTPTRTRNPLFRHRLHVSQIALIDHRSELVSSPSHLIKIY